jgi:proprotein convertase subtilisin/kexin type 2
LQRNTGQAHGKPRLDLNVEEAWAMGFTGKNITTAIMDDGVDYTHPDLMNNFVNIILKIVCFFSINLQSLI